jgi:hypothetical protein
MQEVINSGLRRVENRLIAMDKVCFLNPLGNIFTKKEEKCPPGHADFN